ncbi:MAG: CBS domain-containing protein [Betaproteobacteria bacterium]|nr:CBS domain-containing protein [Betaproteobacteria bacterium]
MPNRPVRQLVKNQRILTASATMSVVEAAAAMREAKVGAIMVLSGPRLVGIFTERDALYRVLAAGKDPKRTTLADVMTVSPTTIGPDMPFGHALHIMYDRGFRHVPVVENGRPIGMVSARDALGPEMEQFEEELREREHITEILG